MWEEASFNTRWMQAAISATALEDGCVFARLQQLETLLLHVCESRPISTLNSPGSAAYFSWALKNFRSFFGRG